VAESANPTCSSGLTGISVDSFGHFDPTCHYSHFAYIYNSNQQYTNKSIGFSNAFATTNIGHK
jgi:hypothetical protein